MIEIQMDNGIVFYKGKVFSTKEHAFPVLGLIFSFNSKFDIIYDNKRISTYGAIIPPNLIHQFMGFDEQCHFIYITPETKLAKDLIDFFNLKSNAVMPLQKLNISIKYNEILDYSFFDKAFGFKFKNTSIYTVDYRVLEATQFINLQLLEKSLNIKEVANHVHLSESRLAHLFKEQIDIPFRKYVLLSRFRQAVKSIIAGNNLTIAAYDAGFSDSAHFSRTCNAMFGIRPSLIFKY